MPYPRYPRVPWYGIPRVYTRGMPGTVPYPRFLWIFPCLTGGMTEAYILMISCVWRSFSSAEANLKNQQGHHLFKELMHIFYLDVKHCLHVIPEAINHTKHNTRHTYAVPHQAQSSARFRHRNSSLYLTVSKRQLSPHGMRKKTVQLA